jgi:polysaccharide deacetylase 2 family uncharacterized protein YibQ
MPKRTRKSARGSPRAVLLLAVSTLGLFAAGEAFLLARSDSGRLLAARMFGYGDRARITRLIGAQVRRGLEESRVPRDSVREAGVSRAGAVEWRVGLPPQTSVLQVNYAITQCLRSAGAEVLSGRERVGSRGETVVTLETGFPRRRTHQITLVRATATPEAAIMPASRLALVLFGFSDDPESAPPYFEQPLPFAVALTPGAPWSAAMFRAARAADREVVLHLPLEPINFPQVNPGPGAILVTMKPVKIAGMVRRYLEEAGPVSAVANHMGSLATQDMEVMRAVYQELKRQRVPFLHVMPAAGAVCKPLAADLGVEYDQPDYVIDVEARAKDTRSLDIRWKEVLETTRHRGQTLVMLRATPLVRGWLPRALARKRLGDVNVVPLESLLRRPAAL